MANGRFAIIARPMRNGDGVMHDSNPIKVSVVLPVYNSEQYLKKCLDSIIGQTLHDIEIICIEDSSSDASPAIIETYAKHDARIKVIKHDRNYGLSVARNDGIKAAKGEYIFFCDSDDWIETDILEKLYESASDDNTDIVYYDFLCVMEDQEAQRTMRNFDGVRRNKYDGVYRGCDFALSVYLNQDVNLSLVVSAFFRRQFLIENDLFFFPGVLHEDLAYTFKAMFSAKRVKAISKVGYFYRRHISSLTGKKITAKNFLGVLSGYAESLQFLASHSFADKYKPIIDGHISGMRYMMDLYFEEVANSEELQEIDAWPLYHRLCFWHYLNSKRRRLLDGLWRDEIGRIKAARNIIVYGAGTIGRETIRLLLDYGIDRFFVAVTRKSGQQYCCGSLVFQIDELAHLKDESLVILAVTEKHKLEMMSELENIGFQDIIIATGQ